MGRFFGRRPDPTPRIARAVRPHLAEGERVLAGVDVQTPGTGSAALQGGVSGGVGAAVGGLPPSSGAGDDQHAAWVAEATAAGIDPGVADRLTWACLVLTDARLHLLRRSRLTRRIAAPVTSWAVDDVDRLEVPRQGQRLTIHLADRSLTFELALAHRFRPAVYDELPPRLAALQGRPR